MENDDDLLAALADATRHAGEPTTRMTAAAEAAYSWRTIDVELAQLTYDSFADEGALVRDAGTASRQLVFEGEGLAVELEHSSDGLVGQLVPATTGTVTLLGPAGDLTTVQADTLGCFCFDGGQRGPVRLRCVTDSADVLTDWIQV